MVRFFPISIGVGAGIGMVLAMALFGGGALVWGLIGGAALGAIFGLLGFARRSR